MSYYYSFLLYYSSNRNITLSFTSIAGSDYVWATAWFDQPMEERNIDITRYELTNPTRPVPTPPGGPGGPGCPTGPIGPGRPANPPSPGWPGNPGCPTAPCGGGGRVSLSGPQARPSSEGGFEPSNVV